MKGVKCLGLLTFFTIFLLSLSLSLDVNAVGNSRSFYNVTSLPLYSLNGGLGFDICYSSNYSSNNLYSQDIINFDSSGFYYNKTSLPSVSHLSQYDCALYAYKGYDSLPTDFSGLSPFDYVGALSGYDIESLPDDFDLLSNLPYRQKTSAFYAFDHSNLDGINFDSRFDFTDIFGLNNFPDQIYSVTIPFGSPRSEIYSQLSDAEFIVLNANLDLYPETDLTIDQVDFGLSDNTSVSFNYYLFDSSGSGVGGGISCDYKFFKNTSGSNYTFTLQPYCKLPIPDDIEDYPMIYLYMSINFDYSSSLTKLDTFTLYKIQLQVGPTTDLITGESWSDSPKGSDTDSAPGSANQYLPSISSDGVNWTDTLIQIFSFSFMNPFSPLFNMFSSDNSCAHIPTLASMLHSSEDTICPWFPSQVRSIVTPVFGLSAVMLVFGFAIRWLGSGSGNMFEDDMSHGSGDFRVSSKFRKRGKK